MADQAQRLDQTIPGGKYLARDGKTYVDAWGKPIKQESPKQASTADKPQSDSKKADS